MISIPLGLRADQELSCPKCNSLQSFNRRERDRDDGLVTVYMKCYMCQREILISIDTPKKARRDRIRIRRARRSRLIADGRRDDKQS